MDGVGSRLADAVAVQPDIVETSYMERVYALLLRTCGIMGASYPVLNMSNLL